MFTLKNFVNDVKDVPSDWIFEYYLPIEKLTGQRVKMKSLFNLKDNDPSMYLYFNSVTGEYKFKCFSTGKNGSAINLMMHIWNLDYSNTAHKILQDYKDYLNTGVTIEKKVFQESKWKLSHFVKRNWTENDAKFWLQFNIGSEILERYNVIPLNCYTLSLCIDNVNTDESFVICKPNVYAYTRPDGSIYKIYQPLEFKKKFLKIGDYIQGSDQLEKKKYMVITSSLKDCMTIKTIPGLDVDVIAPDSENSKLSSETIAKLKKHYAAVVTYMDSDQPGVNSMQYYLDKYNIPFCYVPLEKDFSDIVKIHGIKRATYEFVPVLDKAIAKYKVLND